jgi:two-component system, OmpR family, phosphate regulon sensor histidine kinase PhoR
MPKLPSIHKPALGMALLLSALIVLYFWMFNIVDGPDLLTGLFGFVLFFAMIYPAINFSVNLAIVRSSGNRFPSSITGKIKFLFCSYENIPLPEENTMHTNPVKGGRNKDLEIEELKRNEKFRREFIGNISHELKTPVFSIEGYIHSLIDGGLHDDKVNLNYLKKAAVNLDRLNNILRDLDTITYLESGKSELELLCFNIMDLISDVVDSLNLLAKNYNINVQIKNPDTKPVFVIADKDRIRQVLTNLLSNSIKYGTDGGRTEIRFSNDNKTVRITITDNGIGISKKHLSRLFERFYRVDKSRSRNRGGTGLGLAIVKHIIEAHQQKISVKSTPGEGTTFDFTLKKG